MQETTYYKLKRAELEDVADIEKVTENFPPIDAELHRLSEFFGNFLPLAGGTMSGSIYSSGAAIRGAVNDNYVQIVGGTTVSNGGRVTAYGNDYAGNDKGKVILVANDGVQSASLSIAPDGTTYAPNPATTDNSNKISTTKYVQDNLNNYLLLSDIVTQPVTDSSTKVATTAYVKACLPKSVGNAKRPIYTNASGVATACAMASSSTLGLLLTNNQTLAQPGYVELSNGLKIQWGIVTEKKSNSQVTFPSAFSTACYTVQATAITSRTAGGMSGGQNNMSVFNVTKTGFQGGSFDVNNDYNGFYWLAIGV